MRCFGSRSSSTSTPGNPRPRPGPWSALSLAIRRTGLRPVMVTLGAFSEALPRGAGNRPSPADWTCFCSPELGYKNTVDNIVDGVLRGAVTPEQKIAIGRAWVHCWGHVGLWMNQMPAGVWNSGRQFQPRSGSSRRNGYSAGERVRVPTAKGSDGPVGRRYVRRTRRPVSSARGGRGRHSCEPDTRARHRLGQQAVESADAPAIEEAAAAPTRTGARPNWSPVRSTSIGPAA